MQIRRLYFNWMSDIVSDKKHRHYGRLLEALSCIPFEYHHKMDRNRRSDGADLRYRFSLNYPKQQQEDVMRELDDRNVSVLEMMVALSLRLEETIMADTRYGDRTSVWFWEMIDNLGLSNMTDGNFSPRTVDEVVGIFVRGEYGSDGTGGLFILRNATRDVRSMEIWFQAAMYLKETSERWN